MAEPVRILFVDDEVNVLHAMERIFLDDPYEILTATSGESALQLLESCGPVQVIVSDYRMPGMNGVDFLQEVYQRWPDPVKVILSGYADTVAVVEAVNNGRIHKFIPKPWDEDDLKNNIRICVERYELKLQNRRLAEELAARNAELTEINSTLEHIINERTALLQDQLAILKGIIESAAGPIFSLDREFRYTSFNNAHAQVMRSLYGVEIAVGQSILDYQTAADRDIAGRNLQRALKGERFSVESFSGDDAFNRRYFEIIHNPVRDKEGSVIGVAVFARDMTKYKQAEEKLAWEHSLLKGITDNTTDAIYVKDTAGRYLFCNWMVCQLVGLSETEIIGKDDHALFPSQEAAWVMNADRDVMLGGKPQTYEEVVTTTAGVRTYLSTKAPFHDQNGWLSGLIGIARDINERKTAEEMLQESEGYFAAAFLNSPLLKSISDIETGRYLQVNDSFVRVSEFSREEVIGRTSIEIGWVSDAARVMMVQELKTKGAVRGMEIELRSKSGRRIVCRYFGDIIQTKSGAKLLSTAEDITLRKETEEALQKSRQLLDATAARAKMGGWEIELATGELTWTEQVYRIYEVEDDFQPTVNGTIAFYAPESIPVISAAVQRAIEHGEPFALELDLVTAKGNRRHVHATGQAVCLAGKPVTVSGTFQDITEQKMAAAALLEAEVRYRSLFENSPDPILVIDPETTQAIEFNDEICRRLGYGREEFAGMRVTDYEEAQSADEISAIIESLRASHNIHFETKHRCKNGAVLDVDVTACQVEFGGRSMVQAIYRDITDRKQAEQALKDAHLQIIQQEKLATIGQLAAGVAHEINNPISFVRSNLSSLQKFSLKLTDYLEREREVAGKYLPETEKEELERLWQEGKLDFILQDLPELLQESFEGTDRVKQIVQDLMVFARKDGGESAAVDLNKIVEGAVSITWNELKHKAELQTDYGRIEPVSASPQRLSQVFVNLLVNAFQAIEGRGTISIRSWQDGDMVCVRVTDDGAGIPANVQQSIFEPFFTTKEPGQGTGLGLTISNDIINRYGGKITVESNSDQGSSFTVRLPSVKMSGVTAMEVTA